MDIDWYKEHERLYANCLWANNNSGEKSVRSWPEWKRDDALCGDHG